MPTYCTEYTVSNEVGRVCRMGGQIEADSWEQAEDVAKGLGHTVLGVLVEEIEAPELGAYCDQVQKKRNEAWLH